MFVTKIFYIFAYKSHIVASDNLSAGLLRMCTFVKSISITRMKLRHWPLILVIILA